MALWLEYHSTDMEPCESFITGETILKAQKCKYSFPVFLTGRNWTSATLSTGKSEIDQLNPQRKIKKCKNDYVRNMKYFNKTVTAELNKLN